MGSRQHARVLVDTNQIKKCGDQKRHVPEFNLAPHGLTMGYPIQDAACCRKFNPNQVFTGNDQGLVLLTGIVHQRGQAEQHIPLQLTCQGHAWRALR